jgi:hypothetical protein
MMEAAADSDEVGEVGVTAVFPEVDVVDLAAPVR